MIMNITPPNIEDYPMIDNSSYYYNGIAVPRVTSILSKMLNDDYLLDWANYLGRIGESHKEVQDQACKIGTIVHTALEEYITNSSGLNIKDVERKYQTEVYNAYIAFLEFWEDFSKYSHIEILMQETPLVCQYYGGTLDLLCKRDGKIYLIDWKTSSKISYKYYMQLAAYGNLLMYLYNIKPDYYTIIRLNKKGKSYYEDITIDMNSPHNIEFMSHCLNCFNSLVVGYYERLYIENYIKEGEGNANGFRV